MNFGTQVALVATREITVRLRDRTFLLGTLLFLLITGGVTVLPAILAGDPSTVAVSQPAAAGPLRQAGLPGRVAADTAAATKLVRDGDVDAAVVAGDGPTGLTVVAMTEAPPDVVRALSVSPGVDLLDPGALSPLLSYLVPVAFGLVFFMTSVTFGMQIAQSVTEEKATRIAEILVAAVPARALLAGKIIAGAALALVQIALVAVLALAGPQAAGSGALLAALGPAIGWFVPFFVVGFLLLACMWAVAGALVSRQEDLAAVSMPVQLLGMLPFFAVTFLHDNPTAMTVLSYMPFSAPMAMPLRLFAGDAVGWEPVASLAVLLLAAAAIVTLGARVYESSLLRTNGRTSLATAWREREAAAIR
jgi:ABC-2 type transport system permease protein